MNKKVIAVGEGISSYISVPGTCIYRRKLEIEKCRIQVEATQKVAEMGVISIEVLHNLNNCQIVNMEQDMLARPGWSPDHTSYD